MQRFSIDYITGNMDGTYSGAEDSADAVIHVSNHDGLLTNNGTNYLHTSLHLEDVYSVINGDTSIDLTSPLIIDSTDLSDCSPATDCTHDRSRDSCSDVSPIPSPAEGNKHDRGTPSPNKDSGIESDNSPVCCQSSENVSEKLRELETKANIVSATDKPPHSYIALIAMAILSSRDHRMSLGDIYKHIMENHPYYDNGEKAWRNSIRYNLSINECFIKGGKEENGKGNLWTIHPACVEDFQNGDYRRRQARRRARRTLKGWKSVDTTVTPEPSTQGSYTSYQPMTASYVTYHPYATTGIAYSRQNNSDMAHAYTGHSTIPSAAYTSAYGRYPASQYSHMTMQGYNASSFVYPQQNMSYLSTLYQSQNANAKPYETSEKNQYETASYRWQIAPEMEQATQSENVPVNNNIVIA